MPIRNYNAKNVTLFTCGLSSTSHTAKFYIPKVGKLTLAGWGSFNPGDLPNAELLIEKEVQAKPLDDFEIAGVDFIKIDVEGHEVEVLHGAAKTIAQSRPVVLIEVKKENSQSVDAWFQSLNFRHWTLSDFFNLQQQDSNHIYIPEELIGQIGRTL